MKKSSKNTIYILLGVVIVAACILAFVLHNTPKEYEDTLDEPKLSVHFIDVGQGDSILLESRGEFVLIDAGEKEYGAAVTRYIEDQHASSLKYVIATHPHSDHIGGMAAVINGIDTQNFITVETDQSTRTWLNVLDAVDLHNVNYIDAEVGATYSFGEAKFTILAPLSDDYTGYNNYSVVTKVECGDVSFLLTGDAEKQSEKEMIASGADLSADVLKLGHHGSSTSSTAAFLKAVNPDYAVISCGVNNDYGHPHKETMKKLELLGCPVYRTDEMGTVVCYTDGTTLHFETDKGGAAAPTVGTQAAETAYIGNKNSHVFHRCDCSGVKTMSEKNKVAFENREDAIEQGYTPCGVCEP